MENLGMYDSVNKGDKDLAIKLINDLMGKEIVSSPESQKELARALMLCVIKGYCKTLKGVLGLLEDVNVVVKLEDVNVVVKQETALTLVCKRFYRGLKEKRLNKAIDYAVKVAKALILAGANVNQKDFDGNPIVFSLVDSQQTAMLKLFLKNRVDLLATNKKGLSVFEYAAASGSKSMLLLMIEDARYNEISLDYDVLVEIAKKNGHKDLAEYLVSEGKKSKPSILTLLDKTIKDSKKSKLIDAACCRVLRQASGSKYVNPIASDSLKHGFVTAVSRKEELDESPDSQTLVSRSVFGGIE